MHAPSFEHVPEELRWAVENAFANRVSVEASRGRVLTDDHNPVDFYDAKNRELLRRQLALSYRPD